MQGAVRALGQSLLDRLLGARRTERGQHHLAAMLFFQTQAFFQRVNIRLIDFEAEIGFLHPGGGGIQPQERISSGDLLDAHDDFHGDRSLLRKKIHFVAKPGDDPGAGHYMRIWGTDAAI